ncbi:hypothetical protein C8F01DRAFT_1164806 [Mycena amicta]|nr:hypothetical protein C8F01DRAFT_1164806 [Mycena amicta]
MRHFLSAAPNLTFSYTIVHIEDILERALAVPMDLGAPAIKSLNIRDSPTIYNLMLSPTFALHVRSLRQLSCMSPTHYDSTLCFLAARTLEYVHFNLIGVDLVNRMYDADRPIRMPPSFSCLRAPLFLPTLLSPSACPCLETITLKIIWLSAVGFSPYGRLEDLAALLDDRARIHSRRLLFRWEGFSSMCRRVLWIACLKQILGCVRRGMSWAVGQRLVECYEVSNLISAPVGGMHKCSNCSACIAAKNLVS